MPKLVKLATVVAAVTLLLTVLGPLSSTATTVGSSSDQIAVQAGNQDDEVVLITSAGYVVVEDPFTESGNDPATWTSPEAGWSFVTTGDFNGDGDDEIVALGGARAKIYDPFPLGGTKVTFDQNIGVHRWYKAAAGDIDLDGRDELILLRDDNNTTQNIYAHLIVYDGNATGTQWTVIQDLPYGTQWEDVAAGNFIGDGRAELALVRQQVPTTEGKLLVMNAQTGQTITQEDFGYFFHAVAAGDFNKDGRDEIAAVRDVISIHGSNAVIFQVKGVNLGFDVLDTVKAGTAFMWVAAGDMDADGADEVALLRNVPSPNKGLFGMDIYAPTISLNEVIAEGWTDLQAGDINGDGRADALILKNNLVRAYRVGSTSIIWSKSGSYRSVFALGNIDGVGLISGPELGVSPTTLSFSMNYRGTAPAAKQIQVTNEGSDTLSWIATKSPGANWLTVSPTSGTAPSTIQVSINTAVVTPGSYSAEIIVDGGTGVENSPQMVSVSLVVTGPNLSVAPPALSFSMDYGNPAPPSQFLTLSNSAGTGPINWTARIDPAVTWLQTRPASGTTPGTVEVSIVADQAQAGTHIANVIIDGGPDTGSSPFTVPVTLFVQAPTMQVSPNAITIISKPDAVIPQKLLRVTQQGGGSGAINWVATIIFKDQWEALKAHGDSVEKVQVTEAGVDAIVDGQAVHIASVDWLTVFPTTGTTPSDVHLAFDTVGRELGTYEATVIVDAGAGVINRLGWCDVTMTLLEPKAFLPLIVRAK